MDRFVQLLTIEWRPRSGAGCRETTRTLAIALLAVIASSPICPAGQSPSGEQSGEPLEISDVALIGVKSVEESELRAVLQTRASPWLPWRPRRFFDRDTLKADVMRIEQFYAERGFPHVRVTATHVDRHDREVRVRIEIAEGEPERIADVHYTGFDVLGATALHTVRRLAPLEPGEPLSQRDATQTAEIGVAALGNVGYAYAKVEIRKAVIGPDRVRVEVHADPGELGYFGRVEITGNSQIADDVIRRELAYLPGQSFRAALVSETERRLVQLGLFKSVRIDLIGEETSASVPTRISVKEAALNQFSYSFGYDSEEDLYGEVQWRLLDAFGGGRTASTRGKWSSIERGGETVMFQPYLFAPRFALEVSGYGWEINEPFYSSSLRGGNASVTYALAARNRITSSYLHRFEASRIDVPHAPSAEVDAAALGIDAASGRQSGVLAQAGVEVERDTTRDPIDPRRGYRVLAGVQKAGGWLPGSFDYTNTSIAGRFYQPVGRATIAARGQLGSIVPTSPAALPLSRRYFLGGADTLRGWGRLEVSPLSAGGVPIGGKTSLLLNGELRTPIVRPFSGVVFVDAGNVWDRSWDVHVDRLRSDAGLGLRFDSRFGLLRFDWAYQLTAIDDLRVDGDPRTRRWRMHFGIGQAF